jgi:hypothetical protein
MISCKDSTISPPLNDTTTNINDLLLRAINYKETLDSQNKVVSRNVSYHIETKAPTFEQIINDCVANKNKYVLSDEYKQHVLDRKPPPSSGGDTDIDEMITEKENEINQLNKIILTNMKKTNTMWLKVNGKMPEIFLFSMFLKEITERSNGQL